MTDHRDAVDLISCTRPISAGAAGCGSSTRESPWPGRRSEDALPGAGDRRLTPGMSFKLQTHTERLCFVGCSGRWDTRFGGQITDRPFLPGPAESRPGLPPAHRPSTHQASGCSDRPRRSAPAQRPRSNQASPSNGGVRTSQPPLPAIAASVCASWQKASSTPAPTMLTMAEMPAVATPATMPASRPASGPEAH